jgi:hypothetical protein
LRLLVNIAEFAAETIAEKGDCPKVARNSEMPENASAGSVELAIRARSIPHLSQICSDIALSFKY